MRDANFHSVEDRLRKRERARDWENAARVISCIKIDVIVGNKSGKEKHGHIFMRVKQNVYSIHCYTFSFRMKSPKINVIKLQMCDDNDGIFF